MATNKINPLAFKYLKATEFEQNLSDGGGLFVRVRSINDGGSIKFRFCYRFDGKQRWVTLKAKGLVFVGIDIIGDYLTEINVTSPMGIRQIEELANNQLNLSDAILDVFLEKLSSTRT